MKVDEKDFFHQSTIRICGSLDIEKALADLFLFIRNFMPVDQIMLNRFRKKLGVVRNVAVADDDGGRKSGRLIPMPKIIRAEFEKRIKQHTANPAARILNPASGNPVDKETARMFADENKSVMMLPLAMEDVYIGSAVVKVDGMDRYTEDHVRLFGMLHDPFAIAMANALRHEEVMEFKEMLADDNRYLTRELRRQAGDRIIGADFGLKNVMDQVRQVAPRENPVLLIGETGVGKELIANAIHFSSGRKDGPFIKVNCGAIPDSLIDSELFGHEKGAFTGAAGRKRGRFERANTGTIFLDEIGELPLPAQVRLLRVIQNREIERVGGTETLPVDIRIISATHRNLENMMDDGRFREDLWFRLNVFPIMIPPLRRRKMDIPALVAHFLKEKSKEMNLHEIPSLAPHAIDLLTEYPWKGNVRELENIIERALIQYDGSPLAFERFLIKEAHPEIQLEGPKNKIRNLDEAMAHHIRSALDLASGRINGPGGAAQLLDIHPNTLRNRMDKLGIPYRSRKNR